MHKDISSNRKGYSIDQQKFNHNTKSILQNKWDARNSLQYLFPNKKKTDNKEKKKEIDN